MITGRPKKPVILPQEIREQLSAMVNSRSSPHGLVRRARIVLLAADGISNNAIAERVGISHQMVCHWRKRYLEQGLSGLHDELRPGRPRSISDEEVATLVRKTLETKPRDGTHRRDLPVLNHQLQAVPHLRWQVPVLPSLPHRLRPR